MLAKRVADVVNEPNKLLLPIDGYQNQPLVTLEKAIEPILHLFDQERLKIKVKTAKERCQHPADGLSVDESAAIMFYTFEDVEREQSLYFVLNQTLRLENRELLKPWFLYLKLLFTALYQLPPIANQVLRGVKGDLSGEYARLEETTWWGISSCTNSIKPLQSEAFYGYEGQRTLFIISCLDGRSIEKHSYYEREKEIILLPGRYFRVEAQMDHSIESHMVQLVEIKPPHVMCAPPGIAPWRQRKSGINLEGVCRQSSCVAFEQEVIIPLQVEKYEHLVQMKNKARCPMCSNYVSTSRVSFRRCQWKWYGIQEHKPEEEPVICGEDWKSSDTDPMFILFRPNIRWLQIVFEVKSQ